MNSLMAAPTAFSIKVVPKSARASLSAYVIVDEPYLKEHVVGILFSRSKLTHLQKQVCSHIVTAIKKESLRLKDDWEIHLCSGGLENAADPSASDTYCFEMMSLVLALSGSAVGRSHLASQYNFIKDLL